MFYIIYRIYNIRSLSKSFECLTRKIASRNQFKTYKCHICTYLESKSSRSNRNLHRRFVFMVYFQIYHFNCRVVFYCIFSLFITHVEQQKNNMTSRQWLYIHVYYFYTTPHHLSVWHQ